MAENTDGLFQLFWQHPQNCTELVFIAQADVSDFESDNERDQWMREMFRDAAAVRPDGWVTMVVGSEEMKTNAKPIGRRTLINAVVLMENVSGFRMNRSRDAIKLKQSLLHILTEMQYDVSDMESACHSKCVFMRDKIQELTTKGVQSK